MNIHSLKRQKLFIAISAASMSLVTFAQEEQLQPEKVTIEAPVLEEMLVTGRQASGAQSIVDQRLEEPFSADILGSDQISRVGDSNIAIALTRVPGITLVDGQYIYVRSLGERYSSVQLNGAAIPSPELTRNVLPLDLLPSSIVKSLKVQKSWSPDLPSHFGGGNVDIRTKSIPDELVAELSIGTGSNSESSGDGLSYSSGGDASGLPQEIDTALDLYQGRLNVNGIVDIIDTDGGSPTSEQLTEARTINRNLMLSLNRNIDIEKKSNSLDLSGSVALGNSWDVSDDWTLGALLNLSRNEEVRNKNQKLYAIGNPEQIYSHIERTIDETRELLSFNTGLKYQDMHSIAVNAYNISIIEDEAKIDRGHDASNRAQDGSQTVDYTTYYQERELEILQFLGEHKFDQLSGNILGDIKIKWFYSDSTAETDVPGRATVKANSLLNPETGEILSTRLLATSSVASYAFLTLEDNVNSYGINGDIPLLFDNAEITLSAGYSYNDKTREYYGYTANINAIGVSGNVLAGTPGNVFTDANLTNLNNPFELSMGGGFGTESYIAANMLDAAYGMFDAKWNETWRLSAGARYEDFRQALLPVDLLDYSGESILALINGLLDEDQKYAYRDDGWMPSLALTYMNPGFMDTEDFQIRASYSQTIVRPDLRELSPVPFINPNGIQEVGDSRLEQSELDHYELRSEWVYDNGDNFTVSLFYKDITNPIEQSRVPSSDDSILLTFYNATSGDIYGLEFEGLKELGAGFFLNANITLSDSEIVSPQTGGFTNISRSMTAHSEYVVNTQIGYDSPDEMHSLSLVYNIFGERIYYAARLNGHDDAYEQPFNSVNLVYSFFPTESLTAQLKLGNLLNEKRSFTQTNSNGRNVTILEQEVGTSYSLDVKYSF